MCRENSVLPNDRLWNGEHDEVTPSLTSMFALRPKANMGASSWHVRLVPILLQKSVAGFFGQ
jgi:hypothetical protein